MENNNNNISNEDLRRHDDGNDESNKNNSNGHNVNGNGAASHHEEISTPVAATTATTAPKPQHGYCGHEKLQQCAAKFYWDNEFLILVILSILLARAYPPIGTTYVYPSITATWIAVMIIFVMAGLVLKTSDFTKTIFYKIPFHLTVQVFSFGVVSSIVFGASRGLAASGILSKQLADGMIICGSLSMSINMVLVLTKTSGGDEASAIFNAAFGNLLGVFLSPALILGYIGASGDVDLLDVFGQLASRVVAPVVFAQLLQAVSKDVRQFAAKHQKLLKHLQQYFLVFIVYTVFCKTFAKGSQSSIGDIFLMIVFQFVLMSFFMVAAWILFKVLYPNQPKMRVMALYGCTHKTIAMGVPLINAIYGKDPAVGLYTLPLLVWYPMQLVIGTVLSPRLSKWVDSEKERLGIASEECGDREADSSEARADLEEQPVENGNGLTANNKSDT